MGKSAKSQPDFLVSGIFKVSTYGRRRRPNQSSSPSEYLSRQNSSGPWSAKEVSDQPLTRCKKLWPMKEPEETNLRELNDGLVTLAEIFPDVQIEVFREMLLSFGEESRLAVVTEALLRHKAHWVRGRHKKCDLNTQRIQGINQVLPGAYGIVATEDRFRSASYKEAVENLAFQEFDLSQSTIKDILAGANYSYARAHPTLVALLLKSWRFSISSLFTGKKLIHTLDASNHPLVSWLSKEHGSQIPILKSSGCPELDKELLETIIIPTQQKLRARQEQIDYRIARDINRAEVERQNGLIDCECCFSSLSFEELTACDSGHLICTECIKRSLKEAVFGQGWQRYINSDLGSLRCVAATSNECSATVPNVLVRQVLSMDETDKKLIQKLDERLTEETLIKSGLPLIRCPFCCYAEVDELYLPEVQRAWKFKRFGPFPIYIPIAFTLCIVTIPLALAIFILFSFLFYLFLRRSFGQFVVHQFRESVLRIRRSRLSLKFTCQNKYCRQISCLSCHKGWSDIHVCHESSLLSLRTQVELAMSLAVKRTCPCCNTSFVKSSGCNKLTCVCGYQMCYVCRKEISKGEGYRHFCEHFRPKGNQECGECLKCDLYRCEDDELVVKKAKQKAETRWMEKEGSRLGSNKATRKMLEEKWKRDGEVSPFTSRLRAWQKWRIPDWQQVTDTLVGFLVMI
ncbi:BgTH12-01541 [Blumeria graminis f. sp. triticale]|uniref:BgTH12-01541 n=1 Tax=Blumeria graminis f. sp. triticale TaxID=1689686 RepID=A0A9W4CZ99_BLUGR|nr:BgTH12-01541 [Blumeria graminis f. sp. triticale]